jgi:uncharacterized membrane protein YkvA (DUF1232 family)
VDRPGTPHNEFIDLAEAERLAGVLQDALGGWAGWDERQRQVLTDAVGYLVACKDDEDDEDDLHSPIGFEDDATVVEAALRRLTQPESAGMGSADLTM